MMGNNLKVSIFLLILNCKLFYNTKKMANKNEHNEPIYLKTFTLRDIKDISEIKTDIEKQMILIIRITPLAQRDVDNLRIVVEELYKCVNSLGGEISRLGEERIIITPPSVKIWHKGVEANL
jgi:SepF-like predicted cell division protein (DUF552 family)